MLPVFLHLICVVLHKPMPVATIITAIIATILILSFRPPKILFFRKFKLHAYYAIFIFNYSKINKKVQ